MNQPRSDTASLRDYALLLRRRWWLVLLPVLIAPVSALLVSRAERHIHTASVRMLVSDQNVSSTVTGSQQVTGKQDPQRDLDTLASVAKSPAVALATIKHLHLAGLTYRQLLNEVNVSADSTSNVLTFTVNDPNPSRAIKIANGFASQFMAYRTGIQTEVIDNALHPIQQKIRTLKASLKGVKFKNQDVAVRQQLGVLLSQEQNLQNLKLLQGNNLVVVSPANSAPLTQPKVNRNVLIGAVIGLLLGIALALLSDSIDTRVRSAEEAGSILGLALLARIPLPPARLRKSNQLAMLSADSDVEAEAYRKLRTNFDFANLTAGAKVVMVTSSIEQEGKSTTVANLAVALARSGRRVVLLDLDLRRPFLHRFFGLEGRAGLTDAAVGRTKLDEVMVPIALRGFPGASSAPDEPRGSLTVIPSGAIPPDPADFVGAPVLRAFIAELADQADIVLVDSSPIIPVSDAMTLAGIVDALIVIARSGTVKRAMLGECRRLLDAAPAAKLGFILTNSSPSEEYGYQSYYGRTQPSGDRSQLAGSETRNVVG
jgi:capsular exopolysaccharide synthesis family protein